MISFIFSRYFSLSPYKKIFLYYLAYTLIFLVTHLSLVSCVAFFHFLLSHDIPVIEVGINDNSFELLIISKIISFLVSLKFLNLNLNDDSLLVFKVFKSKLSLIPSVRGVITILFFSLLFPALLNVFEIQLIPKESWSFSDFQIKSFLGNILFVLIDFFYLSYICLVSKIKKRAFLLFTLIISGLFVLFSKSAIAYPHNSVFLFLHMAVLLLFFYKEKYNIGNVFLYSLLCIGGFAILYGVDPVWGETYSLYEVSLPSVFSIIILWSLGISYYSKR